MQYKTLGNSSPQGKQKVYFACHPDDFEAFFETLSDEILHIQSCAVFYDTEDAPLDDDRRLELSQMQLIVMPVTSRLLYMKNRATEELLPFAIEKHIPVLPIMMEQGLAGDFGKVFGDMQYLDKYSSDSTAISYEEKLKKYITSVLVGDETAEKVRKAFDAYIFLSYRKKDRKYAQQLMRLIHENDFARDIAIWYDEFLVPGESFNDAIADMLRKSDLFALVVTPNLTEPNNYVIRKEYPAAVEQGKKILPAEVIRTNKLPLRLRFKGIPDCVDANDRGALSEALLSILHEIAIDGNNNDPEHNFFIGLAYLGGIDVEVNHELALRLITSAAEAELPEAMEKLVSMYSTGEGVERNYETAIIWQEKLVGYRRMRYTETGAEEEYNALFYAMWFLAEKYYDIRRSEQTKEIYRQLSGICIERIEITDESDAKRMLSMCYHQMGFVMKDEGRISDALENYELSMDIRTELVKEKQTWISISDLSQTLSCIGDIYRDEGKLGKAREYYEYSLEMDKALAEEVGDPVSRTKLAISYQRLGEILKQEGKLTEARECFLKYMEISKSLAEEIKTAETLRNLLISYGKLGIICRDEGRIEEAKKYHFKELEIAVLLAERTETIDARRDLSLCYESLSDISKIEGNIGKAKEYCEKSLEIARELADITRTAIARFDLSTTYERLGDILKLDGQSVAAKECYMKSLELRVALVNETATVRARRNLSLTYLRLVDIVAAENTYEANNYISKALELCIDLVKETNTIMARRDLSVAYERAGVVFAAGERLNEAREYLMKSLELRITLADETGTITAHRDLSAAYSLLGFFCAAMQLPDEAKAHYSKALEASRVIADETHLPGDRYSISDNLYRMSLIAVLSGNVKEAQGYLREAISICAELALKTDILYYKKHLEEMKAFAAKIGAL